MWVLLMVVLVVVGHSGADLCHPQCDCLDTYFDCRRRGLNTFPQDFPHWLNKLNMSFNALTEVSSGGLGGLRSLQTLSLDANNLSQIPLPEQPLPQLTYLSLSRNAVEEIEAERIAAFPTLQELDLSKNRISLVALSSFPQTNSSLRSLNLGGNLIENIEEGSLRRLVELQELVLSRNKLKWLPKELFSLNLNLHKLDLSRNKLEVLDSLRFQELKQLQQLNLRRNGMRNLSDAAFYGLDNLQQLYLDGNQIRVVERRWLYGLRNLRNLNLRENQIERLEENCWEYMDQLHTLDLSWNNITHLSKGSVAGLQRLRHLDLSHNKISTLDLHTFLPLHNLEHLDLSFNELSWAIEDVPSPFKGLLDCETINLSGNQLQTLHPEALSGLTALKVLNMSVNPVKWLQPETFVGFPSLSLLLDNVTSFVCDCHATWLTTFQRFLPINMNTNKRHREREPPTTKQTRRSKSSPICELPFSLQGKSLTDLSLQDLTCSGELSRAQFMQQPATTTFLMEGNGSLTCQVVSTTPLNITWLKDHQPLPPNLEGGVQNLERVEPPGTIEMNSTLPFSNVSWIDAASYQCVAQNKLGVVYSAKANVTVHIFPSFMKQPSNITVRLGSNAKLECGAKGYPQPEIAFQKDGGENFPAALERRFHVMPNDDSFIILDAKLIDVGLYCCSAKNLAGSKTACAAVTVYETPSFSSRMRDDKVVEGGTTILECLANGMPRPQITWSKDNVVVHNGNDDTARIRLKESGSLLIIRDAQQRDAGRYECILSNAVGTSRDFLTLTVIPTTGTALLHWSSPVMIVALVVVAVSCVVATLIAWFVVIFRDKRRSAVALPFPLPPQSPYTEALSNPHSLLFPDSGSQSSSGKDSGTGDEILELESQGICAEQEALMMRWNRTEFETFSTFGRRSRLSQPRIDISHSSLGEGDVIRLPRKVAIPVPPPCIIATMDNEHSKEEVENTREDVVSSSTPIQIEITPCEDMEEEDAAIIPSTSRRESVSTAV